MKTSMKGILVIFFILIILPPSSAIFSLTETGNISNSDLNPGEKVKVSATVLLLPEGQPFSSDHSLVISGELLKQKFNADIFADDVLQKHFRNNEGVVFITGQYLSYKVSPKPDHSYKGSSVTIKIETEGTVPSTYMDEIDLIQVYELDGEGKPVFDGIGSIKARINSIPLETKELRTQRQSGNEKQKTPLNILLPMIAGICAAGLVRIKIR